MWKPHEPVKNWWQNRQISILDIPKSQKYYFELNNELNLRCILFIDIGKCSIIKVYNTQFRNKWETGPCMVS